MNMTEDGRMAGTDEPRHLARHSTAFALLACVAAATAALPHDAWPRWLPAWAPAAVSLAALACMLLLAWRERALRGWLLAAFFAALCIAAWHGAR